MEAFKISEVFLIDDDAIVKMVASKILRSVGYDKKISPFDNGLTAIQEIKNRISNQELEELAEPILILLDINMPVMDAWGFMDEFTQLNPSVKAHFLISIITSSIDSQDRQMAFSYPDVKDYITKPISGRQVTDFLTIHGLYEE